HRHLNPDAEHLVELQWTTPETVAQRFAFDVFSGDVIAVGSLTDLVNREDVWVIERQNRACFLFEAAQAAFGFSDFLWQHLQRDFATMLLGVFAEQHLTHATLAQSA